MLLEGKKVLIVEDEPGAIRSYKFKFSEMEEVSKVIFKIAINAKEAREIIETDHPDLIYLDLRLGESKNPEGLEILKEYSKKYNIIIVSGFDEYEDECLAMGAKGYIVKAFDFLKAMEDGEKILNSTSTQQRT